MSEFDIKDSGERRSFGTGAVRDAATGKGRCDLLPPLALLRLAKWYEMGAKKYDDHNWEKGIPAANMLDCGIRHALKASAGLQDEDHLAAAVFNLLGLMEEEERVAGGILPKDLFDKMSPLWYWNAAFSGKDVHPALTVVHMDSEGEVEEELREEATPPTLTPGAVCSFHPAKVEPVNE